MVVIAVQFCEYTRNLLIVPFKREGEKRGERQEELCGKMSKELHLNDKRYVILT